MTDTRHPLRLNVGFLVHSPIGTSRDFNFDFDHIVLRPDLALDQLKGVVKIGRTPQGLLVQGEFEAKVDAECVRCLTDFKQPLKAEFDELFAFDRRSMTESGLILAEDGKIDLEPIVREYLVIELPINPFCKDDCKGLCLFCGMDLNQIGNEHHLHDTEVSST